MRRDDTIAEVAAADIARDTNSARARSSASARGQRTRYAARCHAATNQVADM